ncbi:hypothetical protein ARAF_3062 [Arsenophonus endosymbiont of Aleurodicus floccissimus]|uniref:hypothetical protein n=1 Tax=Arsenophonus endosymbiont of Aleurodicus floccissimus TaxID=2152761 RepID=UPI000E6AE53A|nr:hypothetical protein [Arsenophonus endosymbiont of Aleurodicus floccissimus]SPP32670.1 hypothetical protein ARAF_3062 [Arsenophonus endosymbiont of Aleurodicus floccissimus]
MKKYNLFSLLVAPFLLLSSYASYAADSYEVKGYVADVYYRVTAESDKTICYVAIDTKDNNYYNKRFHASKSIDVCSFAERAKILNEKVLMQADVDTTAGSSNDITSMHFADTGSKWWRQ